MSISPMNIRYHPSYKEGVAINVSWKDNDKVKTINGTDWLNGETKVFTDMNEWHMARAHVLGPGMSVYTSSSSGNATNVISQDGITVRCQANPEYLQIGDKVEVDFKFDEFDIISTDLADWHGGYLKASENMNNPCYWT